MKPIDALLNNTNATKTFDAKKGQSTALNWDITIPEGIGAITYKVVAKAGNFSDGEEMAVADDDRVTQLEERLGRVREQLAALS